MDYIYISWYKVITFYAFILKFYVLQLLESKGVKFVFSNPPKEFIGDGDKLQKVVLNDGASLEADICIVGAGTSEKSNITIIWFQYNFSYFLAIPSVFFLFIFIYQSLDRSIIIILMH